MQGVETCMLLCADVVVCALAYGLMGGLGRAAALTAKISGQKLRKLGLGSGVGKSGNFVLAPNRGGDSLLGKGPLGICRREAQ